MADETAQQDAIELATEFTIAWLSNPNTRAQKEEVPEFLRTMHQAISELTKASESGEAGAEAAEPDVQPAVSVRKSLASKDHLISLIDGKQYKTLKRHLANHGLTPAQYRERYGLQPDYPMVAPAYAERRRTLAKAIGLGRKPREQAGDGAAAKAPARKRRTTKQQETS